jgi:hypothetical protein
MPVPLEQSSTQPLTLPLPEQHSSLPQPSKTLQQSLGASSSSLALVVVLIASPNNITAENDSASIKEIVFFILSSMK